MMKTPMSQARLEVLHEGAKKHPPGWTRYVVGDSSSRLTPSVPRRSLSYTRRNNHEGIHHRSLQEQ